MKPLTFYLPHTKTKTQTKITSAIKKATYNSEYASAYLPYDAKEISYIKKVITQKKELNPQVLVVVGIGGSNLGTKAVYEALNGIYANEFSEIEVYFADTTDAQSMRQIIDICELTLENKQTILVNVVSKSGGTTETIANMSVFKKLFEKHVSDYADHIVVTTDEGSKLWDLAIEHNYTVLPLAKKVGGRYSVFSAVGLFPLGLLGVNITQLLNGAKYALEKNLSIAQQSAKLRFSLLKKGRNVQDVFFFMSSYESVGKWYRQLAAESLGKEYSKSGKKINAGFTPTVSIGSTDLHSIGQLYLGGPYDKFTTFIRLKDHGKQVPVPQNEFSKLIPMITGQTLETIIHAIFQGITTVFKKEKRDMMVIELEKNDAFSVGQLLQFFMIETMYLGDLMNVNAFDQPNVELYKIETKNVLEKQQ